MTLGKMGVWRTVSAASQLHRPPTAAVPNLFGTTDQFCGRHFFHGLTAGGGDGSVGNVSDGERWGVEDEASLAHSLLTSCCAHWSMLPLANHLRGGRLMTDAEHTTLAGCQTSGLKTKQPHYSNQRKSNQPVFPMPTMCMQTAVVKMNDI